MQIQKQRLNRLPLLLTEISVIILFIVVLLPCVSVILPELLYDILKLVIVALPIMAGLLMESTRGIVILMTLAVFVLHVFLWLAHWQYAIGTFIGYMRISYFFWAPLFMAYNLISIGDNYEPLFIIYIVIVGITACTTLIGVEMYPNASRMLAGAATEIQSDKFSRLNIGGYGFVYGFQLSLPMFYYRAKVGRNKLFYYFLIILGAYISIKTKYTTAILLFIVFAYLIVLIQLKRKGVILFLIIASVMLFFALKPYIANLLQELSNHFMESGNSTMAERIYSISKIFLGKKLNDPSDADAVSRQYLWQSSWNTFLKRPLLGVWLTHGTLNGLSSAYTIGGHSELLDTLACSGLVGIGLFAWLYSVHLKNIRRLKNNLWLYRCSLVGVLLFFCLASINTVLSSNYIGISAFLLPVLLFQNNDRNNDPVFRS